jgi:predicted nuclease of predicted toxin-antitoxin system
MPFTIKLDEQLSEMLIAPLQARGYDVRSVREQGWGGTKDPVLWPRVVAEGRFFITADKEFGDIRKFKPGTHPGILLLRPNRQSVIEYLAMLNWVLDNDQLEALAGCVAVATKNRLRVRRPAS